MKKTLSVTPNPGVRKTRPQGYSPYAAGGVEIIPRRVDLRNGLYTPQIGTSDQMRMSAISQPLRVLQLLGDIDPLVSKAQRNTLTLTCAPGDVQILGVMESAEGAGDDSTDDAVTAELAAFWERQPQELGGLKGTRKILTKSALYTGMICGECVPGPVGTGLDAFYPVDPLTIVMKRKTPGGPVTPFQRQGGSVGGTDVELDPEFFLWIPIDPDVDNPYGRPVYSAALPEVLANMAFNQDLRDGTHNSAWKRIVYKYALAQMWETAVNTLKLENEGVDPDTGDTIYPAADWVNGEIAKVQQYLGSLNPDDNMTADGGGGAGGVDTIEGANMAGVQPIIENQRLRVIQALDETPTMMGVEGASFNFGSVAWSVRAQGLEDLRDDVLQLIKKVMQLHLRLMGTTHGVEIKAEPIRTTDTLVDARARTAEIANELTLVDRGYQTDETASVNLTGTGVADEEKAKKAGELALANPAPKSAADQSLSLPPGATAEDRQAGA